MVPEDKLDRITKNEFQRLIDHPFFSTTLNLAKADLAIAFQFVTRNQNEVKFLPFCQVIHYIWERKVLEAMEMTLLEFAEECAKEF